MSEEVAFPKEEVFSLEMGLAETAAPVVEHKHLNLNPPVSEDAESPETEGLPSKKTSHAESLPEQKAGQARPEPDLRNSQPVGALVTERAGSPALAADAPTGVSPSHPEDRAQSLALSVPPKEIFFQRQIQILPQSVPRPAVQMVAGKSTQELRALPTNLLEQRFESSTLPPLSLLVLRGAVAPQSTDIDLALKPIAPPEIPKLSVLPLQNAIKETGDEALLQRPGLSMVQSTAQKSEPDIPLPFGRERQERPADRTDVQPFAARCPDTSAPAHFATSGRNIAVSPMPFAVRLASDLNIAPERSSEAFTLAAELKGARAETQLGAINLPGDPRIISPNTNVPAMVAKQKANIVFSQNPIPHGFEPESGGMGLVPSAENSLVRNDPIPSTATQVPRSSDLPTQVVRQISEALSRQSDRPVEIHLNPEELGKVRMVMAGTETQMTVQIHAERLETTELMRRHLDLLSADLRTLGYCDIAFEFKGSRQDQRGRDLIPNPSEGAPDDETHEIALQPSYTPTTGMDIRL